MKVYLKYFVSLAYLILNLLSVKAQNADFIWAKKAGGVLSGTGGDFITGYGVTTDTGGNVYVAGSFQNKAIFGLDTFITDVTDFFLAKYNSSGSLVWAKRGNTHNTAEARAVTVDKQGNIIIAGYCKDAFKIGTDSTVAYGDEDAFVAKFNSNGNLQWVKRAGGTLQDNILSCIAVDSTGNIYVTGSFSGTATFGSYQIVSAGYYDVFTAKYSAAGSVLWVKRAGNSIEEHGNGTALDADGNVYSSGFSASDTCAILVKRNNNGDSVWSAMAYGNRIWGNAVALYDTSAIYISGLFHDSITIGSTTLKQTGEDNIFIAKYDNSGVCSWAKKISRWPSSGNNYIFDIATDNSGNLFVTAAVRDSAQIDTTWIKGSYSFIVKYNNNGDVVWIKKQNNANGQGLCTDSYGYVYVTGDFQGSVQFGNNTSLASTGVVDMFVGKLTPFAVNVSQPKKGNDNNISAFPNPSKGVFTVDMKHGKYNAIKIFDQLGRCVYYEPIFQNEQQKRIALKTYATGIYYLQVVGEDGIKTKKLIIEQ